MQMPIDVEDSVATVAHADAIAQEKIWLKVLQQTNEKLQASIDMVEMQLSSIHEEGNEWKTRYEVQKEINDYYKKAFFICDQHVPKAKMILRIVNRTSRRGSNISSQLELDEDPREVLDEYIQYVDRLCKELESRTEQEGKAYYWATDIRKRALIELNYTYVPAPPMRAIGEKASTTDEMMLGRKTSNQSRLLNPKYGLIRRTSALKKLPPMRF
ncbi:unnamed protein product [Calicophoron daubneyi]|uniref:Uncharacterized protein n=1 Tax=Calicophoron daubneyi TaxID=300641 RepID=A0AAV2TZ81_CALDB